MSLQISNDCVNIFPPTAFNLQAEGCQPFENGEYPEYRYFTFSP
jgi:hypothetical protein